MTWIIVGIAVFAVLGATLVLGNAVGVGFVIGVAFVIAAVEAEEGTFS